MERESEKYRERDHDKVRWITFEFQSIENNIFSTGSNFMKSHHRQRKGKRNKAAAKKSAEAHENNSFNPNCSNRI
jgi:hypothetical protein